MVCFQNFVLLSHPLMLGYASARIKRTPNPETFCRIRFWTYLHPTYCPSLVYVVTSIPPRGQCQVILDGSPLISSFFFLSSIFYLERFEQLLATEFLVRPGRTIQCLNRVQSNVGPKLSTLPHRNSQRSFWFLGPRRLSFVFARSGLDHEERVPMYPHVPLDSK